MIIQFKVTNQMIQAVSEACVVADCRNIHQVEFQFDKDWENKNKTIVFHHETLSNPIYVAVGQANTCIIPHEVLKPSSFGVSVFAGDFITANMDYVKVIASGMGNDGQPPAVPTPNVYSQIMNTAQEAVATANGIKARADAGEFKGTPGKDADLAVVKQYINDAIVQVDTSMTVSPEKFGAVGDGITDDTVALQKAIDFCCGKEINLLEGVTYVDGYIDANGTIASSGKWITYHPIEIKPDSTYILKDASSSYMAYVVFYDRNHNITHTHMQNDLPLTLHTLPGDQYVRFGTETGQPFFYEDNRKGKILFLDRKKYLISDRLIIPKAITIQGASTEDSILLWKDKPIYPTSKYDYDHYDESNAVISIRADHCVLQGFTIQNQDVSKKSDWHGVIFHFMAKKDQKFYNGTGRHTLQQLVIKGMNSGMFFYAGWNRYIINCGIYDCKQAGIQYKTLEDGNWSASGDIFQSCQFIGNYYGVNAEKAFETSFQNCIFEYCTHAIRSYACKDARFINCWNEANTGNILVDGSATFIGGYNIYPHTITHSLETGADGLVTIDLVSDVKKIRGSDVVFEQINGVITKGVSLGSQKVNLFKNATFGTQANPCLDDWNIDAAIHVMVDNTMRLNDANSIKIDCTGQNWGSNPFYGFFSDIDVPKNTDYVIEGYTRSDHCAGLDAGVIVEVRAYNADGSYAGNIKSVPITPVANDTWEKFAVTFNTGNYAKVGVKFGVPHYGRCWITNLVMALPSIQDDTVEVKYTENPKNFNVVNNLGKTLGTLSSSPMLFSGTYNGETGTVITHGINNLYSVFITSTSNTGGNLGDITIIKNNGSCTVCNTGSFRGTFDCTVIPVVIGQ